MADDNKKSMTIDELAVMVAGGFNDLGERMGKFEGRMNKFEGRMDSLDHQMQALNSNVNNYLELSEKRYSELKQRDVLLAKWIKLVAEKTGVPVDVSQLEKI
jgi:hypothetical protein